MSQGAFRTLRRDAWLLLAVLGLAVRLIVPAGFMVSTANAFPLTICEGHASASADAPGGKQDKAPATPDHACAFAAAHVLSPPDLDFTPRRDAAASFVSTKIAAVDLRPGLGLAAPPPPSHAPPVSLI